MKKIVSLLLSVIMLLTVIMANTTAYAAGFASYAKTADLNTWYTDAATSNDYYNENDRIFADIYMISVPVRGTVSIKLHAECEDYLHNGHSAGYLDQTIIYKNDNTKSRYFTIERSYDGYDSYNGYYYSSDDVVCDQGIYYVVMEFEDKKIEDHEYEGTYDIQFQYTPSISKPSTLKVSSRKTTSLGLNWSKVGDIDGYQLQRKSGDTWKTITNTTSNSYTVSSLKAGTKYYFRVRAYIDVDGTKYYSSWKTLSTPTKPSTPSVKAPSTNKKHQIIVKWNKVSAGTGYQVQFSKKKNFRLVIATKTVSGISKTSYTGKNFTKNKTYYVRVRAYKTVDGTKYYGSWSKVKSVKCK